MPEPTASAAHAYKRARQANPADAAKAARQARASYDRIFAEAMQESAMYNAGVHGARFQWSSFEVLLSCVWLRS